MSETEPDKLRIPLRREEEEPEPIRRGRPPREGSIFLAIAIGAAGGALFAWMQLPLPWMLGAMVFTTVASMTGLKIKLPQRWRMIMSAVIGVMLGAAFTPDLINQLVTWSVTVFGLFCYAAISGTLVLFYFRKIAGYDPVTAYFASSPGGLNEMTLVGGEMGGDERIIALTHAARILLVVMIIPFMFRMFGNYEPPEGMLPPGSSFDLQIKDWLILIACAAIGPFVAKALRLPAAFLLGPMIFSAVVHLLGFTDDTPPSLLIAIAQLIIGTGVGCRFSGVEYKTVLRVVLVSIGSTVILLGSAIAVGMVLSHLVGIDWPVILLAYAPGGLAEMSMVALGIGSDVAFVATHHVFRIAIIMLLAPAAFKVMKSLSNKQGDE